MRQSVEKRRFPGVRVADQAHFLYPCSLSCSDRHLDIHLGQSLLYEPDFRLDKSPVDFDLLLADTPLGITTSTGCRAPLPIQVTPERFYSRQLIFQFGQPDLHPGFGCPGVVVKHLQNHLGSIYGIDAKAFLQVSTLAGR